jgi:acyl-CoA thioesterase
VAAEYPEFWRTLGLAVVSLDPREAIVDMNVPDWAMSPFGAVHGGGLAMVFDTVLAVAVATRLESLDDRVATHQLSVSYATFTAERQLRCTARVVSLRRTVAIAEGELHDATGKLVAKALGTFGIRRSDPSHGSGRGRTRA